MIEKIETEKAPKANGPYSQAVLADNFLFIAGQIPTDPSCGEIVEKTIAGQTRQVLDNIEAILHAANMTFANVVKVEVFVKDLGDYDVINQIYAAKFSSPIKPARYLVQVSRLPKDSLIEICCTAYKNR